MSIKREITALQFEQLEGPSPFLSYSQAAFIEKLTLFLSEKFDFPLIATVKSIFYSSLPTITALNAEQKYLTKNFLSTAFLSILRNYSTTLDSFLLKRLIKEIAEKFSGVTLGKAFSLSTINQLSVELDKTGVIEKKRIQFYKIVEKEAHKTVERIVKKFPEHFSLKKEFYTRISLFAENKIVPVTEAKLSGVILALAVIFDYVRGKRSERDRIFEYIGKETEKDVLFLKKKVYKLRARFGSLNKKT